MKYITEIFLYKRGKYYYIDYMLLNDKETESKFMSYKAIKYSTFKSQLESLLKEYELC